MDDQTGRSSTTPGFADRHARQQPRGRRPCGRRFRSADMTRAVLFDVDFTLIYPGPTFQGEGYQAFCARHGMDVDPARFNAAVISAGQLLEEPEDRVYDESIYIGYTRHIIEGMGGRGEESLEACAREIYGEWAACHHFALYDEVPAVLR